MNRHRPQPNETALSRSDHHQTVPAKTLSMSSPESHRSAVQRADETDLLVALIQGTARGDRNSFAELYNQSARKVHGLALSIAVNQQLSQKITEEVFQTVWDRANAFDPALSTPMAWLMTLTHRAAVHTVRSQRSGMTPPTTVHAATRASTDGAETLNQVSARTPPAWNISPCCSAKRSI